MKRIDKISKNPQIKLLIESNDLLIYLSFCFFSLC